MKRSLTRDLLILLAVFAVLWAGFAYLPFFKSTEENVSLLSVANEEKLGHIITTAIEKDPSTVLCNNPILDSAMKIIKFRLVNNIGLTEYEYHIKVIENNSINAFTVPGGNIYVFSGLISFCETPEELAAVLAHEIGHAEKRHVVSKLAKEVGMSILFSAVSGKDGGVISGIGRTSLSTVFDREQEKEADDFSFALMERAGLNPRAMSAFMIRIRNKYAEEEKVIDHLEWLSTHPNTNSRIKAALEYKPATGFTEKPLSIEWQKVKDSLKKKKSAD